MKVDVIVMTSAGELSEKSPDSPGAGHAIRPARAAIVIPEPAQLTVQPPGPHAGPVLTDPADREPRRQLPDEHREIDPRPDRGVQRARHPRVHLHQLRVALRVAPEFNL